MSPRTFLDRMGSPLEGAFFRGEPIPSGHPFSIKQFFEIAVSKIKASLWDFDHTIGDFEILHRLACKEAVHSLLRRSTHNEDIPNHLWKKNFSLGFGKPTSETNEILVTEALKLLSDEHKEVLNDRLNRRAGDSFIGKEDISFLYEKAVAFVAEKREEKFAENCCEWIKKYKLHLNPGVKKLLETLHAEGVKLGLVTSSKRCYVEPILKHFGIHHLFDTFVYQDDPVLLDAKRWKPDPLPYQIAMKRLGVTPEETAGHEDSITGALSLERAGVALKLIVPANNNSFFRRLGRGQADTEEFESHQIKSGTTLIVLPERTGWENVSVTKLEAA